MFTPKNRCVRVSLAILGLLLLGFWPASNAFGLEKTISAPNSLATSLVAAHTVALRGLSPDTPTSDVGSDILTEPVPKPSVVLRHDTPVVLGATTDATDETTTTLPTTGAFPLLSMMAGISALMAGGAFGIAARHRSAHATRTKKS